MILTVTLFKPLLLPPCKLFARLYKRGNAQSTKIVRPFLAKRSRGWKMKLDVFGTSLPLLKLGAMRSGVSTAP